MAVYVPMSDPFTMQLLYTNQIRNLVKSLILDCRYKVKFEDMTDKPFTLENTEDFDAVLLHPGIQRQKKAINFIQGHPNSKIAIITPMGTNDYRELKEEKPDVTIITHDIEEIVNFIEGS